MLTQNQVKDFIALSELDHATQRIATGWFVKYRDGAGYYVCRGKGFIGPMNAGKALETYKARVFTSVFGEA
jgi:hypothetical protein